MTWLILGLMAVIAIVIVVVLGMRTEEEVIAPAPVPVPVPEPQTTSGLGGPVFKDEEGKKTFLKYPITGSTVWVVTPHGPQLMSVDGAGDDWMDMSNGQYIAEAKLNHNYFDGIGREQSVWTVTRFTAKSGDAVRHGAAYQHRNQQFIRDEVEFWEDDTLDWLVFYWFMFDGFHEPFNYYDQYEVPALDTPEEAFVYEEPVVEEPVSDEPTEPAPVDDVPEPSDALAEVTEDQINEFNEESPPEPTPAPEPIPEPEPTPAPEPEPYTPPPAPEPEPYTPEPEPDRFSGGFGDDSGSSFDSGGFDDGGSDFGGGDDW